MPRIRKEIIIDIECCKKCGAELYRYDEKGKPPPLIYGVYWDNEDYAYCEDTCIPNNK